MHLQALESIAHSGIRLGGAELPAASVSRCPVPCGTRASSPGRSDPAGPVRSTSSSADPLVTTWNQRQSGIGGMSRPQGAVSSERK